MGSEISYASFTRTFGRMLAGRVNRDGLLLLSIFALSVVIYLTTAARAVTFADAGDFLMGISLVGNVHGPGYPLFLMTAKLFTWVFPFGTLPFRVSMYSALFAALTACLLYWIVYRLTCSRLGGVIGGLAYLFSYTFWYESVIPETYSLNSFFLALLVILALRWERQVRHGKHSRAVNTLCVFAFCFGLALTNHMLILLTLPAFIFFALDTDWRKAFAPRNLARVVVFFVLGLLPYVYQPVAAFRGPAYNYGDPSTLNRWYRHITVYGQREGLFEYPYLYLPFRFGRYFGTLNTEFPYFAWLGGLGFVTSWIRKDKKYPLFLLLLFLFTLVPVMTYRQIESVLRAHSYHTSYMIVAIWLGMGAAFLGKMAGRIGMRLDRVLQQTLTVLIALLLILCPLFACVIHYDKVDKSDYYYAADQAKNMLLTADAGGVILSNHDNIVFPCLYLQLVHGVRPDVRTITTSGAGYPGFGGSDLLAHTPEGYRENPGDAGYEQLVERNYRRLPIYDSITDVVDFDFKQVWLGYLKQDLPRDARVERREPGPTGMRVSPSYLDSDAREAILNPQALLAVVYMSEQEYSKAVQVYREIIPLFERDLYVPTLYSVAYFTSMYEIMGVALNEQGRYNETIEWLSRARKLHPDFRSTTLARAYLERGQLDLAIEELDKCLDFDPEQVQAMNYLAEAYIRLGRFDLASQELDRSLQIDPDNPMTLTQHARLLEMTGRTQEAVQQYLRVVELDSEGEFGDFASEKVKSLEKIHRDSSPSQPL